MATFLHLKDRTFTQKFRENTKLSKIENIIFGNDVKNIAFLLKMSLKVLVARRRDALSSPLIEKEWF